MSKKDESELLKKANLSCFYDKQNCLPVFKAEGKASDGRRVVVFGGTDKKILQNLIKNCKK